MGKSRLLLGAAIAITCLPAGASAEPIVPPGNSAATQYTEAFPTAGGEQATGGAKHGKQRTPAGVLGARDARRLNRKGPEGRAAAALAAATVPISKAALGGIGGGTGSGDEGSGASRHSTAAGGGGPAGPGGSGGEPRAVEPSGAPGLESVLGRATGSSSSGQIGLLLPLAIAAVFLWSLAYLLRRQRRRVT